MARLVPKMRLRQPVTQLFLVFDFSARSAENRTQTMVKYRSAKGNAAACLPENADRASRIIMRLGGASPS
jgi:hypothetical protein